jgi:hypothetical protein
MQDTTNENWLANGIRLEIDSPEVFNAFTARNFGRVNWPKDLCVEMLKLWEKGQRVYLLNPSTETNALGHGDRIALLTPPALELPAGHAIKLEFIGNLVRLVGCDEDSVTFQAVNSRAEGLKLVTYYKRTQILLRLGTSKL